MVRRRCPAIWVSASRTEITGKRARRLDEEERTILENAHQVAKKLLEENRAGPIHLTRKLLTKETLEGPELEATFSEPLSDGDYK